MRQPEVLTLLRQTESLRWVLALPGLLAGTARELTLRAMGELKLRHSLLESK